MQVNNKFQPSEWLNITKQTTQRESLDIEMQLKKVEQIVKYVELKCIDITKGYQIWLKIGFSLSSTFGEQGRELFHRLSLVNSKYAHQVCDKQYDNCMASKGNGITIRTLYYYAQKAGIPSNIPEMRVATKPIGNPKNPSFPIIPNLPPILVEFIKTAKSDEERGMLLSGAITAVSSCLPGVFGFYEQKEISPNLFMYVVGPTSSGKGKLEKCLKLIEPIDDYLRERTQMEESQYQIDAAIFKAKSKEEDSAKSVTNRLEQPTRKMLLIAGNNSSSGVVQLLKDNGGFGLIFETEGDTITYAFKSEHGNYADLLRKALHNERCDFNRRGGQENKSIKHPILSVLVSGTPEQLKAMIPSAENGLLSRFIFYPLSIQRGWRKGLLKPPTFDFLEDSFKQSEAILKLFKTLQDHGGVKIIPSPSQMERFDAFFDQQDTIYQDLQEYEFISNLRRMGLICMKIFMVLTMLRYVDKDIPSEITVQDVDFNAALMLVETFIPISFDVYQKLIIGKHGKRVKSLKDRYFEALPDKFDRAQYLQKGKELGIKEKTADNYVSKWVESNDLSKPEHNRYQKNQ